MKVKQVVGELRKIQETVKGLECYEKNKLALDTWVIGQIEAILDKYFLDHEYGGYRT